MFGRVWNTLMRSFIKKLKRTLPTGVVLDNSLNLIHAWQRLGYFPNVSCPRTFNEYILANKRNFPGNLELARRISDKVLFKDWLKEKGYETLIVPSVCVFSSVDEMVDRIFEQNTIIKPSHLSGEVIILRVSRQLNSAEIFRITKWLKTDFYKMSREETYRGIKRKVIQEKLLLDAQQRVPMDFKFFCVFGNPFMIQVDMDRFSDHMRQLYSPDWIFLDFGLKFPRYPNAIDRPECLPEALDIARALSRDFPFCRVDLYLLPGKVIKVGEITFFPGAGAEPFSPRSADLAVGQQVQILLTSKGKRSVDFLERVGSRPKNSAKVRSHRRCTESR